MYISIDFIIVYLNMLLGINFICIVWFSKWGGGSVCVCVGGGWLSRGIWF